MTHGLLHMATRFGLSSATFCSTSWAVTASSAELGIVCNVQETSEACRCGFPLVVLYEVV